MAVNCAAIPATLAEAELFGVERGAYTGAEVRPGLLELADKGTLLLDEVGELALATQAKLLSFLDEGTVRRVGGTVYVTEFGSGVEGASDGSIVRVGRTSATGIEPLAESLTAPTVIRADSEAIYWIERDPERAVMRLTLSP